MSTIALLFCGLFGGEPDLAPAKPDDLAAYESARASAGRDAASQVRLALWCEAHGLSAERTRHLALAVLADPKNAAARGLMGLVAYRGRWDRPETVAARVKADEALAATLAGYNARRDAAPATADGQWKLALWCEQNGLDAEAKAHLAAVVRLDPSREAAWKKLGCKKVGGRWVTEADLAAGRAESEAQKKADKRWRPLLAKWRGWLTGKDASKRQEAEDALATVTDPRAVPAVWSVFAAGGPDLQSRAVTLFGQIDTAGSSRALAMLAVFGETAEARRAAAETLKRRDPREFAGLLVGLLRDPVKYEVHPVGGPGSPGAIFVEGKKFNVQRIYAPPAMPVVPLTPFDRIGPGADGLPVIVRTTPATWSTSTSGRSPSYLTLSQFAALQPTDPLLSTQVAAFRANAPAIWQNFFHWNWRNRGLLKINPSGETKHLRVSIAETDRTTSTSQAMAIIPIGQMMAEYQKSALTAQEQLTRDVAVIDDHNDGVQHSNARVARVLSDVSGKDLGEGRKVWDSWWTNLQGYAYTPPPESPRPTLVENVPLAYTPAPVPVVSGQQTTTVVQRTGYSIGLSSTMPSCFGAGTLVRTIDGAKPIESVQVGDRLLTQDVASGSLGYHPVTFVHHNPPSPTFLVKINGDTIVSSPFHRFWVAGRGWVMARDLKGGETLRLLGGPARVDAVEAGPVQPVFNLDVDEAHDFFAGSAAALVHDNSLPNTRLVPFDAPPALAAK